MLPIGEIAAKLGVAEDAVQPYGKHIAKIGLDFVQQTTGQPDGRLILVTAITPTPAGEGKTTTTVGLSDALNHPCRRSRMSYFARKACLRFTGSSRYASTSRTEKWKQDSGRVSIPLSSHTQQGA
jgi:formyltetrahydrofolate synthetase